MALRREALPYAFPSHLWMVSQKLYKNSSDISDRAVAIATQKSLHDSNLNLIRMGA